MPMQIRTPADIGTAIRQVRKDSGIRQDDIAAVIGVSHVTLGQIERGHPGTAIGAVLALLAELGIQVHLDVPTPRQPSANEAHKPRRAARGTP